MGNCCDAEVFSRNFNAPCSILYCTSETVRRMRLITARPSTRRRRCKLNHGTGKKYCSPSE